MSNTKSPKKILAINFGGIGDEILFLPTLSEVKELLPDAHISLILEPRSKSVKEVTNLVDAVVPFDIKKRPLLPGDYWQLLSLTRAGKYDLVISSGSSPMVAMLLFASGIPVRIGYDAGSPAKALLTHPVKLDRLQYAGNMYHDLVRGLRRYLEELGQGHLFRNPSKDGLLQIPKVTLNADSRKRMKAELEASTASSDSSETKSSTPKRKRVLLHPGTSRLAVQKGIIKTWESKNWLDLIEMLLAQKEIPEGLDIILAGGPDDEEVMKGLMEALGPRAGKITNFYGKTKSLADLAALMDLCDLIVCVDSAPMHVAVGLDKDIVALFGPTDPSLLIPNKHNFCALSDQSLEVNGGGENGSRSRSLLDGLGVRLLPDIVFRSSMDLLTAARVQ